jgi:uncharacterized membrane protein
MANLIVQGANLPYVRSGNSITNAGTFNDMPNLVTDATDLENVGGIKASRVTVITPAATGSTVYQMGNNTDTLNIQGTTTINALTINFPLIANQGANIHFVFDVAVTTLTLVAPSNYTISTTTAAPTTATAGYHILYELIGNVWKQA